MRWSTNLSILTAMISTKSQGLALIRQIRSGDRTAAATFLSKNRDRTERIIRSLQRAGLRPLFDTDDVLASVMRRADEAVAVGALRPATEAELWTWIERATRATVLDYDRIVRRLRFVEAGDAEFAARLAEHMDNTPDVEMSQFIEILGPTVDREIVVLWLKGNTHSVIAKLLGMNCSAVRKRFERSKREIRRYIEAKP